MSDFVVLTVDDDITQLELVDAALASDSTHSVIHLRAETLAEGSRIFTERRVDLVITDYLLPDGTGLDLLDEVKRLNPLVNVIVITGHESIEHSVAAMKRGADDYLVKPINGRMLARTVNRIIESWSTTGESAHLSAPHMESWSEDLVFQSAEMADALNIALRGARSTASVLIRGESGTGKELFARLIHNSSPRRDKPFVAVNVAALPESVIESELFGHRKGAFTGATQNRVGRFVAADGGTLFLDELGDMPLSVQVELLRAVQFKQIEPVGDDRPVDVDVRIVAATNRNLEEMIVRREFREDLYYRLNVLSVRIPPLRDRKVDIPLLVEHMRARHSDSSAQPSPRFSAEAMDRLMRYGFPGNVRELENVVERATLLAQGRVVLQSDLPDELLQSSGAPADVPARPSAASFGVERRSPGLGLDERLAALERELIVEALRSATGNQSMAAERLGIGERRLRSRMERLGIENSFRTP